MPGIPVSEQLLRQRCHFFSPHGENLTFREFRAVMCNTPYDGIQILEIEEARNCISGVFQVRCPKGCSLAHRAEILRVNGAGEPVELRDVLCR